MKKTLLSEDRIYRYTLWREWPEGMGYAMFIGLNPSTADETKDDNTIRKCVGFAKSWGYAGLYMLNLFAFRARDPEVMKAAADPVGEHNNLNLMQCARYAGVVVAAWGPPGAHMDRDKAVRAMIPKLHYLRLTKDGFPGHPLYLPGALTPREWT